MRIATTMKNIFILSLLSFVLLLFLKSIHSGSNFISGRRQDNSVCFRPIWLEVLTYRHNRTCTNENSSEINENLTTATSSLEQHSNDINLPENINTVQNYLEDSVHLPDSGGLAVKDLLKKVRQTGQRSLIKEYEEIGGEPPDGTFQISMSGANLHKNRYSNIICLDATRVILSNRDDGRSTDYINANFVDGYKHRKEFISTQGPLPQTFGDFWRMVCEQGVLVVVMVTRTVEQGRVKCGQYWPTEEGSTQTSGDFTLSNTGVQQNHNYMLTTLTLTNVKTGETRDVHHFQFVSWPDFSVPNSAEAFLEFLFHVRKKQEERVAELGVRWKGHPRGPPIVVHCSAGIGRTGTFITMDILTRRLDDVGTVDVQTTVRRLRTQRAFSVQTAEQYAFIYKALIEYAPRKRMSKNIV